MFDPNQHYNGLPLLPPQTKLETEQVLRKLGEVKAALATLKEAGRQLPDPSVVLQSMTLQEAKLSSEIENIFTTNDELYRQIDGEVVDQSAAVKEIRRYRQALWKGYEKLRESPQTDLELVLFVGQEILERNTAVRQGSGTRIGNRRTGKVIYTPPEGAERISNLISNLCEFINHGEAIDPLIRIAVSHYQFEAIHPFEDGNGRTGRVLNIIGMVQFGILDLPILYLSQEFLENRREYYDRLRGVTENGEWEEWILFFLDCVEVTAIITRRQFQQIQDAVADARVQVREKLPRWFPAEVVDVIFTKPYCRISDLVDLGIAKRQTAAQYLKLLESIGLLRSTRQWRETLYLNPHLLEILSLKPDID